MSPEEISTWLRANSIPDVLDRSDWRRIERYGLEVTLRERVEEGLREQGVSGALAAIAVTVTEARRLWMADRRAEQGSEWKLSEDVAVFMRQYGRKKQPGGFDPNDRHYDRKLEKDIKRMDPRELDILLHGGDEELSGGTGDEE